MKGIGATGSGKKANDYVTKEVTRDGKSVTICATREIGFGWSLMVAGTNGYCNHWTDFFHTSEKAIDEALKAIDEEGIDEFYQSPFGESFLSDLSVPD